MSNPAPVHTASTPASGDRLLPALAYVLYLMGPAALVGFIMAYVLKGSSIEPARSHYVFMIRTAWIALAAVLVAMIILFLALPLTLLTLGWAGLQLSHAMFGLIGLWWVVRTVVGLIIVLQGRPYPRPQAWLI